MNTKFQVVRETKNAKADAKKILGSFFADSRTRYTFVDPAKKADMVYAAYDPDQDAIANVFGSLPFSEAECIKDVDFRNVELGIYDVLRKFEDQDAELKDVNRSTIYTTTDTDGGIPFHVKVIGEWWKTNKRGQTKKRGERLQAWFDDTEVTEVYDFAIDQRGHIAPKQYGIGSAWTLAKTTLDEHATKLATEARIRTHMYTRVDLVLERVASGNSTQRTQK